MAKKVAHHQNQIGKRNPGKAESLKKFVGGKMVIAILLFVVVGSALLQVYQALMGNADSF